MTGFLVVTALLCAAPKVIHVSPAGPSDGDGTLEKPLRSVEKALARAAEGDTIRLAAGSWTLGAGQQISVAGLAIEGGWDAAFQARDPFGTPSTLLAPAGLDRPMFEVAATAHRFRLDGVTLDGATALTFGKQGVVDGSTPKLFPLVRLLRSQGAVLRNNVFLNAPAHAVSASVSTELLVENNVMLGARVSAVTAWGARQGAALKLRRNTILGVWPDKPGGERGDGVDVQQFLAAELTGNLISHTSGACVRLGRGNPEPIIDGNVLGQCLGGALVSQPGVGAPVATPLAQLATTPQVEARNNRPLPTSFTLDPQLGALGDVVKPAPDAGPRVHYTRVALGTAKPGGMLPDIGAQAVK